jgi:hypothetical protein
MTADELRNFPDKVGYLEDGWAVRFNGCLEGARWSRQEAAELHLSLLQQGLRAPQPEIRA